MGVMTNQNNQESMGYLLASALSAHLREQINGGEESDNGATFKPMGKNISAGCQACKSAGWICIYLSYECNKRCQFCPQDRSGEANNKFSGWDPWGDVPFIDLLKERAINLSGDIKGISFSGGESLMQINKVPVSNRRGTMSAAGIYNWLDVINNDIEWKQKPYLWIYTSGHLISEKIVNELVSRGINEIRFNLAASDYSDEIIRKIESVRGKVDYLSVEVPVLSWQLDKLIGSLKRLDEIGVDYINLHELLVTKYNAEYLRANGYINEELLYENEIGGHKSYNRYYLPSVIDIYTVIRYIDKEGLNLIYNDCSARNARLQSHGHEYQRLKSNSVGTEVEPWEEFRSRLLI
jgi:pyruvate formate-lyase activating enzyme-like uncharacterized protein